jgi:cytoskeletal protein CcmA (bactofilin family)
MEPFFKTQYWKESTTLWNKREDVPAPRQQPQYEPPPRPQAAPPAPAPPPKTTAVIGASMQIKGEIRTREELMVDGEVEGLLESQSSLTVGSNGKVKANIKAREVIILGSVKGNIEVTEKISIRDKGSLVGDIKTAGTSIEDGAYFKGSIDIIRPEPAKPSKSAAVAEPARA